MSLSKEDGKLLIEIARKSISLKLKGTEDIFMAADGSLKERFKENGAGFVTLTIDGELRGCIGYTEALFPLWETIAKAAQSAAFQDPRFPPLSEKELDKIKIEISVLTKPEEIPGKKEDYPKKIKIGKHGLIVESGKGAGLLLPQVFTEYKADSEKALEMTCQKAGLPSNSWKEPGCKVYTFSAQIFEEK